MATMLFYDREDTIRNHYCATPELADAAEAYIAEEHGARPVKRRAVPRMELDPGGMVFGCDLPLIESEGLPNTYAVHPSHVRTLLESIEIMRSRENGYRTYGERRALRVPNNWYLNVIPAEDVEAIVGWLVGLLPEADAFMDAQLERIRNHPNIRLRESPLKAKA